MKSSTLFEWGLVTRFLFYLTFSFKKPSLVRNGGESTGLESGLKPLRPLRNQLSWKLSQMGTV